MPHRKRATRTASAKKASATSRATPSRGTRKARRTAGRVMHEFKHGELKRGRGGKGGPVKSRKQAVAIALSESGQSRTRTKAQNRRAKAKTAGKEARGKTAQQRREGRARIGARGKADSTHSMGGHTKAPRPGHARA